MQFIDLHTQYQQIEKEVNQRIHSVLAKGQFILGEEVKQLEQRLAHYVGVKHCIAVANGTDALLLSLMALNIRTGDEIIIPAFTYIAVIEVIVFLGAIPVLVDIEPDTYNLDATRLEKAITPRTKAIMPTSLYGQCADYEEINKIATQYALPVIEDAGQSFGASHNNKKSCGLTTFAATSFFPSKPFGCYGDGGACFTNDDYLAEVIGQLHVHGEATKYDHVRVGMNSRLDTIQAAVLLAKLEIFDEEVVKRQQVAKWYSDYLDDSIKKPYIKARNKSVWAQYTLAVSGRESLRTILLEKGIPTAVHYPLPIYRQPAYQFLAINPIDFPVAEQAAATVLSLPMHPYLTEDQVKAVAEAVNFNYVKNS